MSEDGFKDRDNLRELYIEKGLTQAEIGDKFSVTSSAIGYWVDKFDLNKEPEEYLQQDIPISEATLRDLYWDQKLSQSQISDEIGYQQTTIGGWLREYNIETRGPGGVQEPDFDREEFERLYVDGELGLRPIAEELNTSRNTLARWRDRWGIEAHNTGSAKRPLVDDGELVRMYIDEGLTQQQIASKIDADVNQTTVSKWLTDLKVNIRNKAGWGQMVKTDRGETVKSALEKEVADWMYAHGIDYTYEPDVDQTQYVPDFLVGDKLVEVWGVRMSDKYDSQRKEKMCVYNQLGFDVISVFPSIGDKPGPYEVLPSVFGSN